MNLMNTSDKAFWHGYVDFYEHFFAGRNFANIAEIGILKGNSIRWLLERFPKAHVCGADILPVQPQWPVDPRFSFTQLDQGNVPLLRSFLTQRSFDLIIEDGSHFPHHQTIALVEGVRALAQGGIYILEDIHTSHPGYRRGADSPMERQSAPGNALSVLLAIDHYKRISRNIDGALSAHIARDCIMTPEAVLFLAENISKISLYRRTRLPDYCYNCGSSDFNFSAYKCKCGVEIFSDSDSMSFVIEKR